MKKLIKKIKVFQKQIIITGVISIAAAAFVYFLKPNQFIAEFPYMDEQLSEFLGTNGEWTCDAVVSTELIAFKDSYIEKRDGIKGRVNKGTDKVNIKIDGDVLQFNTRAGFDVGLMEGEPFMITRDDDDFLIAVDTNEKGTYIDTFILDKSTGLATWTKNRTSFLSDGPETHSFYLVCL